MTKILFMTTPEGLHRNRVKKPVFGVQPLGIFYLESSIRKYAGTDMDTKCYDAYTLGASQSMIRKIVEKYRPDIVAVSTVTQLIYDAYALCSLVKNRDRSVRTVLGGPHISAVPESIEHEDVDFGVIGEGEETLLELVLALTNDGRTDTIKGLVQKVN